MTAIHTVSELPPSARVAIEWLDDADSRDSRLAQIYSELLCSPVMNPIWRALKKSAARARLPDDWPIYFIMLVTGRFVDVMVVNPPNKQRTDAERIAWLKATLLHTRALAKLLSDGEVNFGLLDSEVLPDDEMVRFLRMLGVPADPSKPEIDVERGLSSEARRRAGIPVDGYELNEARINIFVRIHDALHVLETTLARGIESAGPIRKPRDEHAPRASFIFRLSQSIADMGIHISDSHLADLCSLVLNDETITRSLVNRFRFKPSTRQLLHASA